MFNQNVRRSQLVFRTIGVLILMLVSTRAQAGHVVYVDDDAPAGGDGSTWNTAFRFLQDALTVASSPANEAFEIRIGQGIYRPDEDELNPTGSGDRFASFLLINNVELTGGYAGRGQPDPDVRNVQLYQTVFSGDLDEDDGPDFANNSENSLHVVVAYFVDSSAVLKGVFVASGNANGSIAQHVWGGGILIYYDSSPMILECTLMANSATKGGGIEVDWRSKPLIQSCNFIGNRVVPWATVIPTGGGLACIRSGTDAIIVDCIFQGNHAEGNGGGAYCGGLNAPRFVNCKFFDNSAVNGGGLYSVFDSAPTILNGLFVANHALSYGGGALSSSRSSAAFRSCNFVANTAGIDGGGIGTFASQYSDARNCTLWNNLPNQSSLALVFQYSLIEGGWAGLGSNNIDADPLFIDPDGPDDDPLTFDDNDYRLQAGSPCIDAGHNWGVPLDEDDADGDDITRELIPFDLSGDARIAAVDNGIDIGCGIPAIVDIGAYEYQGIEAEIIFADTNGDSVIGVEDLLTVLGAWGLSDDAGCVADFNLDGLVNVDDLLIVLANWD
ncbi:MAG: hypothetical protein O7G85_04575 [Planctomycetota bacterium]|nr:hypothetical protein [Planctomycetota bacterium]